MAKFIEEKEFTHVGITVITPFRKFAYSILQIAKKINPSIITLAGGPHVTYAKEKIFLESSFIDIAVAGEAEENRQVQQGARREGKAIHEASRLLRMADAAVHVPRSAAGGQRKCGSYLRGEHG